jgi:hypothetical protein
MDVVKIKLKDKSISDLKAILDFTCDQMTNDTYSKALREVYSERYSLVYEILDVKINNIFV